MRILQMVDVPWDSGLAHYALSVSQRFQADGHEVWISTIPKQKPWLKAERLNLRAVPLATWKSLPGLRSFLRQNKIDLINAHTGATHSVAVMASLGQRVAVVRTRSDARAVRRSLGSGFLYRRTARVIAAADYIRKNFIDTLELPPDRVVTIYQGVDTDAFRFAPLPPQSIVLGIAARLDPVKGHRYLLEALALLRPAEALVRLKIAGQQENIKEADLKAFAGRLGIDRYVDFLGHKADIAAFMRSCTIGIIASTGSEAVSRVALEWMSCGRPIVSTRVGCLGELIQNRDTGLLVEPKNVHEMAGAIGNLLSNPASISLMAQRARQRAEQKFSLDVFYKQTLAVYKQAIAEQK